MIKDKIKKRKELVEILTRLRKKGKKIGLTNGVFDIIHIGHVKYLEKAKRLCDVLVVSVNTDKSVKKYKGKDRPLVTQKERAGLIASLESVDYVTFHGERRMKKTLETLKPDFYIKGGDYKISQLTSSFIVKKLGGKTVIIPIIKGKSTTNLIKKIAMLYGQTLKPIPTQKLKVNKAIFLDRDGVINKEIEYLHEPEKFEVLPNVVEGLKKMQEMGYKLCIVTTQAGIGLGYFTKEDFYKVNKKMFKELSGYGIKIDKVYFCPHNITENCNCRKPKIGLMERAQKDLNIDKKKSFMIGDKTQDIKVGENFGCKTILVKTGYAGKDKEFEVKPDFIARDLIDAANYIKKNKK